MTRDERPDLFLAESDLKAIVIDDDWTLQNLRMCRDKTVQFAERHLIELVGRLFVDALLNGQEIGRPIFRESKHLLELSKRHALVGQFFLDEWDILFA